MENAYTRWYYFAFWLYFTFEQKNESPKGVEGRNTGR